MEELLSMKLNDIADRIAKDVLKADIQAEYMSQIYGEVSRVINDCWRDRFCSAGLDIAIRRSGDMNSNYMNIIILTSEYGQISIQFYFKRKRDRVKQTYSISQFRMERLRIFHIDKGIDYDVDMLLSKLVEIASDITDEYMIERIERLKEYQKRYACCLGAQGIAQLYKAYCAVYGWNL